jgi:hypothetical protein
MQVENVSTGQREKGYFTIIFGGEDAKNNHNNSYPELTVDKE